MDPSKVIENSNGENNVTESPSLESDIRAPEMILVPCSQYFYRVFGNFDEREQQRIGIGDIPHSTFRDVRDACCQFMKSRLKPSNCFEIQNFANNYRCEELLLFVNRYVEENYWQVVKHREFLTLTQQQFTQLISSDYLMVPSEETIFESIISWVNFDLENRKQYLAELMEHVRIPLLSQKYIVERVKEEPLLNINMQCQQFIIKAMEYQSLDENQKILSQTSETKPRQPRNKSKVLLVAGCRYSYFGDIHNECYNYEDKKWYQVSEPHLAKFGTKLAVVEERVYKIGDPDGNSINVYDPFSKKWSNCRDMMDCRKTFDVAVLDNCIYVVGGENGGKSLDSVGSYDPRKNEWQMIPSMCEKRDGLGVGVVNGFLYAIGGYDWESKKNLSSAERYDPEKKKWESIANMSAPRCGAGVGVIDDILYAVGGCTGEFVFRSVEAYNPAANKWELVAEMSKCRIFPGVAVFNGMLYVVGGFDGTSNLSSVEVFSPATNSWTTLPNSMSTARNRPGVAIVDKLRAPPPIILH